MFISLEEVATILCLVSFGVEIGIGAVSLSDGCWGTTGVFG